VPLSVPLFRCGPGNLPAIRGHMVRSLLVWTRTTTPRYARCVTKYAIQIVTSSGFDGLGRPSVSYPRRSLHLRVYTFMACGTILFRRREARKREASPDSRERPALKCLAIGCKSGSSPGDDISPKPTRDSVSGWRFIASGESSWPSGQKQRSHPLK
jgi:hypothetical protein